MSTLVNALRTENSLTLNGMVTNSSSLNSVLDLFYMIGSIRSSLNSMDGRSNLISLFESARNEDPLLTRKLLFWARDIRGGAGEREAFRILLRHSAKHFPQDVIDNIDLISEYGRWDDLFCVFNTPVESHAIELIIKNLQSNNVLLAKWMPRLGGKVPDQKKHIANKVRVAMGLTPKEYRKMLVGLTNVVETSMCSKEYEKINYEHVPSVAMSRYSKAFTKNDETRFSNYITALSNGEAKINAAAVYPYNVVQNLNEGNSDLATEQWKALPNYMEGSNERVLPLCDVSGSMGVAITGTVTAMDVCISLGLYISERNEGPFKDAFMTFSENPELVYLNGDLRSRFSQLRRADWGMSTNLERAFSVLLKQAIKHNVSEDEMPTCILILSDMEFNQASRRYESSIEMIKRQYNDAGYVMPKIVYWNLNARLGNIPVNKDENGTALISGFSPSILKTVLSGSDMNPVNMMIDTLNVERYSIIK